MSDYDARAAQLAAERAGDLTGDDYDRLFGPPEPEEDRDELARLADQLQAEDDLHDAGDCDPKSCPVCAWVPEPEEVWPSVWPLT